MTKLKNTDVPNHISVGLEGQMFLVGGSNDVLGQYEDSRGFQWLLGHWRHAIYTREKRLRALGVTYKHITIPEKLTVYDNLLGFSIDWRGSPALRLYNQDPYYRKFPMRLARFDQYVRRRKLWRKTLIDLVGPLRSQRDHQPLYLRTDTHWTFEGRMIAYREVCKAFNAQPIHDFHERRTEYQCDFSGDLGSKCEPKVMEGTTFRHAQRDSVRVYASPIVEHRERIGKPQTLHTGSHVVWHNEKSSDSRRMVLFGDSYSHFAPIQLSIMLAETFRELHFVWSTRFDYGFVERVKPDLVLTEMAERFIFRPPDDDWDLERYAAERFAEELGSAS